VRLRGGPGEWGELELDVESRESSEYEIHRGSSAS
jgi:hypothetical protein